MFATKSLRPALFTVLFLINAMAARAEEPNAEAMAGVTATLSAYGDALNGGKTEAVLPL